MIAVGSDKPAEAVSTYVPPWTVRARIPEQYTRAKLSELLTSPRRRGPPVFSKSIPVLSNTIRLFTHSAPQPCARAV